jgi:outer membrane autotransporter protein
MRNLSVVQKLYGSPRHPEPCGPLTLPRRIAISGIAACLAAVSLPRLAHCAQNGKLEAVEPNNGTHPAPALPPAPPTAPEVVHDPHRDALHSVQRSISVLTRLQELDQHHPGAAQRVWREVLGHADPEPGHAPAVAVPPASNAPPPSRIRDPLQDEHRLFNALERVYRPQTQPFQPASAATPPIDPPGPTRLPFARLERATAFALSVESSLNAALSDNARAHATNVNIDAPIEYTDADVHRSMRAEHQVQVALERLSGFSGPAIVQPALTDAQRDERIEIIAARLAAQNAAAQGEVESSSAWAYTRATAVSSAMVALVNNLIPVRTGCGGGDGGRPDPGALHGGAHPGLGHLAAAAGAWGWGVLGSTNPGRGGDHRAALLTAAGVVAESWLATQASALSTVNVPLSDGWQRLTGSLWGESPNGDSADHDASSDAAPTPHEPSSQQNQSPGVGTPAPSIAAHGPITAQDQSPNPYHGMRNNQDLARFLNPPEDETQPATPSSPIDEGDVAAQTGMPPDDPQQPLNDAAESDANKIRVMPTPPDDEKDEDPSDEKLDSTSANETETNEPVSTVTPEPPPAPSEPTVVLHRPALDPIAGAYLGNARAANTMFQINLTDRLHSDAANGQDPHRGWVRYSGSHGQWKDESGALRTQGDKNVVLMGVDMLSLARSDGRHATFGLMGGQGSYWGVTRSAHVAATGAGQLSGFGVGLYGTYHPDLSAQQGFYTDGWMLWNQFDNRVKRSDSPAQTYASKGLTGSIELGYNLKLANRGRVNTLLQPHVQFVYQNVRPTRSLATEGAQVSLTKGSRLQTTLGIRASTIIPTGSATAVSPRLEANWLHTNRGYGVRVDDTRTSMRGARDIAQLKLAVQGQLNPLVSLNVELFHNRGSGGFHDTGGNIGLTYRY